MCTITLLDRSVGRPLRLFLPPGCVVCVMYLSSTARDTDTRSRKAWYFSSIQYRSLRSIHDSATRFKYVWFSINCQLILFNYLILQSAQYLRRVALLSLFACKLSVDPFHFCPGNIFFCCNYYLFILNRISDFVVVLF